MILNTFTEVFLASGRWMFFVLTLLLVLVLLAAWKRPAWTLSVGKAALVAVAIEVFSKLISLGSVIQETGSWIHPGILGGGIKLISIHCLYAGCIYLCAIVADIIRNK